MGKTSRWLKSLLSTGKKERDVTKLSVTETHSGPISVAGVPKKEKRRWSFRRLTATVKNMNSSEKHAAQQGSSDSEVDAKADTKSAYAAWRRRRPPVKAASRQLSATATARSNAAEEAAAIKIQSIFRSYLARKALRALKGLVKLQAFVRGDLVRKQARATLRCMQALIHLQSKAREQRIQMLEESQRYSQLQFINANSQTDMTEENVKTMEMDVGEISSSLKGGKGHSTTPPTTKRAERRRISDASSHPHKPCKIDQTEHFNEFPFTITNERPHGSNSRRSSFGAPRHRDDDLFSRSYMAETESSRAKARTQSVPRQRPDSCERRLQSRRTRTSMEMQRSSSVVGSTMEKYYKWIDIKLDRSNASLKDSECGSTSTVFTDKNY